MLGAGDAFMAGFLRGWLRGEPLETACAWANACGAFAVSRLLCSPEYPTWEELQHFLRARQRRTARCASDAASNHIHWATTRRPQPDDADGPRHRPSRAARGDGRPPRRAARAASPRSSGWPCRRRRRWRTGGRGFGMLLDGELRPRGPVRRRRAPISGSARPVEQPGSRPLAFDRRADLGAHLVEWPVDHTVKCLCFYHPDDAAELKERQEAALLTVYDACRVDGTRAAGRDHRRQARTGRRHDRRGGAASGSTRSASSPTGGSSSRRRARRRGGPSRRAIRSRRSDCRGVVLLGLEAPEERARSPASRLAAAHPIVKGFAVGRTIFSRGRRAMACRATSTTARRSTTWRHASGGCRRLGTCGGAGQEAHRTRLASRSGEGAARLSAWYASDDGAGAGALPGGAEDGDRRRGSSRSSPAFGRSSGTATWRPRRSPVAGARRPSRPIAPTTSKPWRMRRSPSPRRAGGGA